MAPSDFSKEMLVRMILLVLGEVARLAISVENIASPCAWRLLTICCDVDILVFSLWKQTMVGGRFFCQLCAAFLVGWFQLVGGVEVSMSTMMRV